MQAHFTADIPNASNKTQKENFAAEAISKMLDRLFIHKRNHSVSLVPGPLARRQGKIMYGEP